MILFSPKCNSRWQFGQTAIAFVIVSVPPSASCFKWWTSKKGVLFCLWNGAGWLQDSQIPLAKWVTHAATSWSRSYLVDAVFDFFGFLDPIGGFVFGFLSASETLIWKEKYSLGVLFSKSAIISSIAFAYIAFTENYLLIGCLFISLCGSCAGFLKYNKYPSKIIMGDGGSYFLGFIFASFGILASTNLNQNYNLDRFSTNIFLPVTILALPLFDMARVIFMRILNGLSPLYPDRRHLHHKILDRGLSHNKTVFIIYLINILFLILALFIFVK